MLHILLCAASPVLLVSALTQTLVDAVSAPQKSLLRFEVMPTSADERAQDPPKADVPHSVHEEHTKIERQAKWAERLERDEAHQRATGNGIIGGNTTTDIRTSTNVDCVDFVPVHSCDSTSTSWMLDDVKGQAKCESTCLPDSQAHCKWESGKCVPGESDACKSQGTSQCTAEGTSEHWPKFVEAAKRLFEVHDGSCQADTLSMERPSFRLYSAWRGTKGLQSLCEDESERKKKKKAQELMDYYAEKALEEHSGGGSPLAVAFDAAYADAALTAGFDTNGNELKNIDHMTVTLPAKPKMVFVLGASGSGKTFSTKLQLLAFFAANGWSSNLNFFAIDGGIMREVSAVWQEIKAFADVLVVTGFEDLYDKVIHPAGKVAKKRFWEQYATTPNNPNTNILYPDTAVACGMARTLCPLTGKITAVKDKFDVSFIAINTDKNNCQAQGTDRAATEGKHYDSKGWSWSIKAVPVLFDFARKQSITTWFMVHDNNNHPVITKLEHKGGTGAQCRHNGMGTRFYRQKTNYYTCSNHLSALSSQCDYQCPSDTNICQFIPESKGCPTESPTQAPS
jgi:hypothetical protein